jgi:hypothetical protein
MTTGGHTGPAVPTNEAPNFSNSSREGIHVRKNLTTFHSPTPQSSMNETYHEDAGPEAMASPHQLAEAYAFSKLAEHLRMRTDVQNIDVMILSGFCRNCLSKWCRPTSSRGPRKPPPAAFLLRLQVPRGRAAPRYRHELRPGGRARVRHALEGVEEAVPGPGYRGAAQAAGAVQGGARAARGAFLHSVASCARPARPHAVGRVLPAGAGQR